MMDSSFLTWVNVGLAIYVIISVIKMMIQFGLPNHPARVILYLILLCVMIYFTGLALTDLGYSPPFFWMRWRALPLVGGSLAIVLQVIFMKNSFSRIQQKVISRVPIIASILCFAFFARFANFVFIGGMFAGLLFLSIPVGQLRYPKRQYLKMVLFLSLSYGFKLINLYWFYVLGEVLIFVALFYFFIFEQSVAIAAQMDDFKSSLEGDS